MVNDQLVKYHNDLNTVSMRKWTSEEMNFFFAIITKSRDKGTQTLLFDTDELKELTQFADKHKKRWDDTMEGVSKRLSQLTYIERTENKIKVMPLFQYFEVDIQKRTIEIEVSRRFEYVLNKLDAHFTTYELKEFTSIRSTYAKTMYRLLKQWRTIGKREFKIEDFRYFLGIPKSYATSDIDKAVLKPILKELVEHFGDLKINKIKSKKRGNPVIAYEFTWKAEKTKKKIKEIDKPQEANQTDYDVSEMLETFKKVTGL